MGTDIHSFAEVKQAGAWEREESKLFNGDSEPFGNRSYAVFGFLADVRNYSEVPVLVQPRGLPDDSVWLNEPTSWDYTSNLMNGQPISLDEQETNRRFYLEDGNYHSFSWILLTKLLAFDYDSTFEDLRTTSPLFNAAGKVVGPSGATTTEPGKGKQTTYREFLGPTFFLDLAILQTLGQPDDVRIVFWFDN